jgi:prevent-host-death family protein
MSAREIKAGEFKAKCLKLMDEVAATGEAIVITKRGKPIARIEPVRPQPTAGGLIGFLAHRVDPTRPETTDYSVWDEEMEREQEEDLAEIEAQHALHNGKRKTAE